MLNPCCKMENGEFQDFLFIFTHPLSPNRGKYGRRKELYSRPITDPRWYRIVGALNCHRICKLQTPMSSPLKPPALPPSTPKLLAWPGCWLYSRGDNQLVRLIIFQGSQHLWPPSPPWARKPKIATIRLANANSVA